LKTEPSVSIISKNGSCPNGAFGFSLGQFSLEIRMSSYFCPTATKINRESLNENNYNNL